MKSKLPFLTDEFMEAIAHVAIRSAQLDHMIELFIVQLYLPHLKTTEKILKNWSTNRQVEIIESMLNDRFPWYEKKIEALVKKIEKARSDRNEVIHYVWGKADKDGAATLASYRPFRDQKDKTMTAKEVGDIADALLDCVSDLHNVHDWLAPSRPPWPNMFAHMLQQENYLWPLDPRPEGMLPAPQTPPQPGLGSSPKRKRKRKS